MPKLTGIKRLKGIPLINFKCGRIFAIISTKEAKSKIK
jgi:hypothetical protein